MNRRRIIQLTLTALLAWTIGLLAGCSSKSDSNTLVVGMELAYPPFEMTDEQNQPSGISVDLAQALGQYLGKEVRIENIPFSGLIPALKTGMIDLVISSMTANEERAKSIDFSDPYLKTGLCLLVGSSVKENSIDALDRIGRTFVVKQGTTGHLYAHNNLQHAEIRVLEKESVAVLEVVQGKADAFIYDQMSTYMNWKKNESTTRPLLKPFQKESWSIGLRKDNSELREQVNAFLREFENAGGFDALGDKYLGEQKQAFQTLGYPFYF